MFFPEPLRLTSGRRLHGYTLRFESYGTLSATRDNAVLICHGLTHNAHAAGRYDESDTVAGWWDNLVGPGKSIDTDRFYVICINCLGGCAGSTGPSSIDPHTECPYGLRFPVITIGDMVQSQKQLTDQLGINRFKSVIGGCMGGFQALEWMVRFPRIVDSTIIISTAWQSSAHTLALWQVLRQAIMDDPNFQNGDYYEGPGPIAGMGLASMFGMLIWMSTDMMAHRFGRSIEKASIDYTLDAEYSIQHFFNRIRKNSSSSFDPNSLIYLTKAMDYFDLTRGGILLPDVFRDCLAKVLLVSYNSDWRYPPEKMAIMSEAMAAAGLSTECKVLESPFGHGAFHCDSDGIGREINRFLNDS